MKIKLFVSKRIKKDSSFRIEEEINDLIDVYFYIGKLFSHYKNDIDFIVEDFDEKLWSISMNVDFVVFLEQYLDLIKWLSGEMQKPFILSFYEQGIETDVKFDYIKRVVYYSKFSRDIGFEEFVLSDFKKGISDFYYNLIFGIEKLNSSILENQIVYAWLNEIEIGVKKMNSRSA